MAWFILIVAGLFEAGGVWALNGIKQKRTWLRIVLLIILFTSSLGLLSIALQTLAMGTAYAIWTGIGTIGGTIIGIVFYHESFDWRRIACLTLILLAVIGLKLVG